MHTEPAWLLDAVSADPPNGAGGTPWSVADAPRRTSRSTPGDRRHRVLHREVEAKAKLSQNKDDADFAGVVTGLRREGAGREHAVADTMAGLRPPAALPADSPA